MKKKIIIITFILIIFGIIIWRINPKETETNRTIKINLNGPNIVELTLGEKYNEDGYKALDSIDGDITNKVKVKNNINYDKVGSYEITYSVKNGNTNEEIKRYIKINEKPKYKDSYSKIDNTIRGWWSGNKKDHTRSTGGADINELKKYNAYFLGKNEKVIYLTFDEGANESYIDKIAEVLDKNNVKATFFVCGSFILHNQDLVRKMALNGHSFGNHTNSHKSMPTLATKKNFDSFINELQVVEDNYFKVTGKHIDKIYRDPRGEWSYRGLQIVKDLGYKTYFYSADYYDFAGDVSKEYALNELLKRYHNGAIYLMHPKNKGNYEALDSFINEMKQLGYKFDLVKNIP